MSRCDEPALEWSVNPKPIVRSSTFKYKISNSYLTACEMHGAGLTGRLERVHNTVEPDNRLIRSQFLLNINLIKITGFQSYDHLEEF